MNKTIKPGSREVRSFLVAREAVNEAARTVELSFSSEEPYDRFWGREILDHSPNSVRLGRLTAGGPVLMDHSGRDHVGVIESVQIGADRVGRAVVRFGKGARADEVFRDVVDGIRRSVSVGYVIHKAVLQEVDAEKNIEVYRVTDWEPYEISLVSVPADTTVGVGREAETNPIVAIQETKEKSMPETKEVDVKEIETRANAAGRDAEAKRAAEIIAIGAQYKHEKMAAEHVSAGKTVEQFKAALLEKLSTTPLPTADIGLSDKETKQYSFLRAINALANPTDRKAQESAKFEAECSHAVADKTGKASRGLYVPNEVLKRDLTVGTATAGGNTVATNLLAQDFITLLRNAMILDKLGIRMLSGLSGNIAIPRATGGATAYWVAESASPTESQQAFDQVTMSPKTVGAFSDISRKLLLQSSVDVEGFVRQDLATVLGLALQAAAINGSGASNQPLGILNTTGIGDVAGGTNGLAPALSHIVELETDIAVANADTASMAYLTNAKVRGKLKQTFSNATYGEIPLWQTGANGDGTLNGYRSVVTNAVPSNLTKGTSSGVCSAIIFGNFSDLIMGLWGSLDLMVDPYTNSTSGTVRVVVLQDVDVAVRHAESFSAMLDALTA